MWRSRTPALLLILSCWVTACRAHVALEAPAPNAAPEARLAAYETMRPLADREVTQLYDESGRPVRGLVFSSDYLQLSSGRRVYFPEDLLPVIPAESACADAADTSATLRHFGTAAQIVGYLGMAGGLGLAVAGFTSGGGAGENDRGLLAAGLGTAAFGVLLFALDNWVLAPRANKEAARAFAAFGPALRAQLELCGTGSAVSPCEAMTPSAKPQSL